MQKLITEEQDQSNIEQI